MLGGEQSDINFYVKIRLMPSIRKEEAFFLKGTILRKNIINKKMRRDIPNAKILIISGNLEYKGKHEETYEEEKIYC